MSVKAVSESREGSLKRIKRVRESHFRPAKKREIDSIRVENGFKRVMEVVTEKTEDDLFRRVSHLFGAVRILHRIRQTVKMEVKERKTEIDFLPPL